MLGIFLKIGGFFLNPRTAAFAWGAVLVLALAGYGVWSWNTIQWQKRDKADLVEEVKGLKQDRDTLIKDQKDFLDRAGQVMNSMEDLNRKVGQNAVRRQHDYEGMTGPSTKPDGTPTDTSDLEDKANTGMNGLFEELNTLSREHLNASSQ